MNIRYILQESTISGSRRPVHVPSAGRAKVLLGLTELASMGLLTGAVALWAVALWPLH
jgi:hypothetical protein